MADHKKILIVEDETPLLEALSDGLSEHGFSVSTATNGQQGLEKAEEVKPDLILLDLIMPIMGGMDMLKQLRATEWGKEMAVIILTNVKDTERVAEALDYETFNYLSKTDHTVGDIVNMVRQKLG